MVDNEDHKAIGRVLSGDHDAYRGLMERHFPLVYRVAYRIVGNPSDAEDIAQEVFLKAYNKLSTFRREASFSTWVHRIAMNTALNVAKGRSRELARQSHAGDDDFSADEIMERVADTKAGPEQLLLDDELRRIRDEGMSRLTLMERNAFTLRHIEELSIAEVAQILDVPINSAKQAVFRGVGKLRGTLAAHANVIGQSLHGQGRVLEVLQGKHENIE